MELLLISDNKIKISLTRHELDSYGITCDNIDYDNTETRRVFWTLLDEVNRKVGFDAAKSRIFIQIYPDRSGGCEIYVSKIKGESISPPPLAIDVKKADDKPLSDTFEFFSFDSVECLLSVCRRLKNIKYTGLSSAYSDDRKRFYLKLENRSGLLHFITEFGVRHTSKSIAFYIEEHCTEICSGNAVEKLGEL